MGLFDFFKNNSGKATTDLSDFKFISDDHIRYQNGKDASGHNYDCWRGIRVQKNIAGGQGYSVTMYNLDGNHPTWSNNIQMATKQMKVVEQNSATIMLKGFGNDQMGATFTDYGLTLFLSDRTVDKVTLHMFDRNVDIVYFKAKKDKSNQSVKSTIMNLDDLIKKLKKDGPSEILGRKVNPEALAYITAGDKALQENNYSQAIAYFTKAIELDPTNRYPFSKRGKCYQMTQVYDKALADLFKSKELQDNFENNQSIAECYLFKKEYSKAVQYFGDAMKQLEREEIVAIDTGNIMGIKYGATKARVLNNQAVCHYHLQQLDQAIECSTRGIQANPKYLIITS